MRLVAPRGPEDVARGGDSLPGSRSRSARGAEPVCSAAEWGFLCVFFFSPRDAAGEVEFGRCNFFLPRSVGWRARARDADFPGPVLAAPLRKALDLHAAAMACRFRVPLCREHCLRLSLQASRPPLPPLPPARARRGLGDRPLLCGGRREEAAAGSRCAGALCRPSRRPRLDFPSRRRLSFGGVGARVRRAAKFPSVSWGAAAWPRGARAGPPAVPAAHPAFLRGDGERGPRVTAPQDAAVLLLGVCAT